jgi:hypothetical protein
MRAIQEGGAAAKNELGTDRESTVAFGRDRYSGWERRHAYGMDRTGQSDCRAIIVRRENAWGEMVTRRIHRCG